MLKDRMDGHNTLTDKQWEKAFSHANVWYSIAEEFGLRFLLYLPVDAAFFANTW